MERLFDYQANSSIWHLMHQAKQLAEDLKPHFVTLRPIPTSCHGQRTIFVHLHISMFPMCSSRMLVYGNHSKTATMGHSESYSDEIRLFISKSKETSKTLSIDKLKPAFMAIDSSSTSPQCDNTPSVMQTTCAGRPVSAVQTRTGWFSRLPSSICSFLMTL